MARGLKIMLNDLIVANVSSHVLLKHRSESCFHVYLHPRSGTRPLCQVGLAIDDLKSMDIPGDRSPCCNDCSRVLYGFPRHLLKPGK